MTVNKPPPLLGYNTNVRHGGTLFHIQTEDSGIDHPHIITHLFVEGTVLATKKHAYNEVLTEAHWADKVRQMMKDQHRQMFIELRDGVHDGIAISILGPLDGGEKTPDDILAVASEIDPILEEAGDSETAKSNAVRVIRPAVMTDRKSEPSDEKIRNSGAFRRRSIFDSPSDNGEFGENLITDKSLDEVILSYLTDELEE